MQNCDGDKLNPKLSDAELRLIIQVVDKSKPKTTSDRLRLYTNSKDALWYWITIVTSTLSAAAVFFLPAQFYPWAFIRQILGILLVLWFPGYSIMKATLLVQAFFKSWSKTEITIAKICLSLCMSLAITSLITLFLNYMPWGIQSYTVTLGLLGFTVLVSTVALAREHRAITTFQK